MTRLMATLLVIALAGLAWMTFVTLPKERERRDKAETRAHQAAGKARMWQARFATEASHVERAVDTVRVITARYKQVRDSVLITDTLRVVEFIRVADSAIAACSDLANTCQQFRVTADSLFRAKDEHVDALVKLAESNKPSLVQRAWLPIAIGSAVLGAFLRGQ